ncbi:MAG: DUF3316 domain-containing protein [Bacteroidaceae bacterium]|nr:DUF3316 domain-containing protein [Bacteroidaceae bacterium]
MARRLGICLLLLPLLLGGTAAMAQTDSLRAVRHTHLFGVGSVNLLDTYLSPLEYTGWQLSTLHTSARALRPGSLWTLAARYGGDVAYAHSPTDNGKDWDANFAAAVQLRRRWQPTPALTLEGGGAAGLDLGGTYSIRNGNNPAQGRLGAWLGLSGEAAYRFRLWKRTWTARATLDVPLAGAKFSPQYGQSYYEIFELGHRDHNVCATWLGNAPSAHLTALLEVPTGRTALVVGYEADVRQSHVNGLKYHTWGHRFIIGWTRRVHILK